MIRSLFKTTFTVFLLLNFTFLMMPVHAAPYLDTQLGSGIGGAVIDSHSGGLQSHSGVGTGTVNLNFDKSTKVEWNSFNLNSNETLNFKSASGASDLTILNSVSGGNMSQIYGTINADTGISNLIFSNPAGLLFDGATVTAAGDVMLMTADPNKIDLDTNTGALDTSSVKILDGKISLNGVDFTKISGGQYGIQVYAPVIEVLKGSKGYARADKSSDFGKTDLHLITNDGQSFIATNLSQQVQMESAIIGGQLIIDSKDAINAADKYYAGIINVKDTIVGGDTTIKTNGAGTITIGNTTKPQTPNIGGTMTLESDSGLITVKNNNVTGLSTLTTAGNIKSEGNTYGTLNITAKGATGTSVQLTNDTVNSAVINATDSSDIIIKNLTDYGTLQATNSKGIIQISDSTIDGSATLENTDGDILIGVNNDSTWSALGSSVTMNNGATINNVSGATRIKNLTGTAGTFSIGDSNTKGLIKVDNSSMTNAVMETSGDIESEGNTYGTLKFTANGASGTSIQSKNDRITGADATNPATASAIFNATDGASVIVDNMNTDSTKLGSLSVTTKDGAITVKNTTSPYAQNTIYGNMTLTSNNGGKITVNKNTIKGLSTLTTAGDIDMTSNTVNTATITNNGTGRLTNIDGLTVTGNSVLVNNGANKLTVNKLQYDDFSDGQLHITNSGDIDITNSNGYFQIDNNSGYATLSGNTNSTGINIANSTGVATLKGNKTAGNVNVKSKNNVTFDNNEITGDATVENTGNITFVNNNKITGKADLTANKGNITMTKNTVGSAKITNKKGTTKIDTLAVKNNSVEIDNAKGALEIKGLKHDSTKGKLLVTNAGNIDIENSNGYIQIDNNTGYVDLSDLSSAGVNIYNSTGNIYLEDSDVADSTIKTVADAEIRGDVTGDITVTADNLTVDTAANARNYTFNFNTIRSNTQKTITSPEEITYEDANGVFGYNVVKLGQTRAEGTTNIVVEKPVDPTPASNTNDLLNSSSNIMNNDRYSYNKQKSNKTQKLEYIMEGNDDDAFIFEVKKNLHPYNKL